MSDYLDGTDAFDRLLDKLMETHESALRDRSSLYEEQARLREANRQIASLTSAAGSLTQEVEVWRRNEVAALPKLAELYAAAEAARGHLLNPPSDSDRAVAVAWLKKAMDEANPYCDQIPF